MARPASAPETSLSTPRIVTNPWIILLVLSFGFFMILLDTTIVNVAIPSMIDGLHASLDQVLWVLNGYILAYAVLLITTGRLGDMVGPKKLFMSGLVIFTLSSAACGIAQSPNELIAFRVIQGIGGAILTPQSLSIITSIFPPEKRGGAFGVWGAVAGLAAVTGPTLGGFLTTTFTWRAIFYVNVPIGIVVTILAFLLMPELTVHRKHDLDVQGVVLSAVGLFGVVSGLIEGERYHWGPIWNVGNFSIGSIHASLISIPTILAAGVIVLIAFIIWEARESEPLLPLSLFRDRNFTVANIVSAIVSFGMFGLFLPMTIFLQSDLGLDAEHAGVVFVPMSLTSMLIAPFAGRLADRINGKYILFVGLTLFALGMGLVISVASLTATGLTFTPALVLAGVGMGCTFAPMITLAMRNLAPAQAGAASGFINTIRQVGGAFGSAVVGAVLQNRLATELHSQSVHYAAQLPASFRAKFISGFAHASQGGFQVGRGQTGTSQVPSNVPVAVAHHLATLAKAVFDHAFLNAMKPSLALSIGVMALGAVATLFMRSSGSAQQAENAQQTSSVAAAGE
jgi:EmrB/QacA subfamily drug resistance transporter